LIAIVQTLYKMVRNGETWDLGEVELNEQGLPVVHDIAEKLGCVRQLLDTPCAVPEDEEVLADSKEQPDFAEENFGDTPLSRDSVFLSKDPPICDRQPCQQCFHDDQINQQIHGPEFGKGQEAAASNSRPTPSSVCLDFQEHDFDLESPVFGGSNPFRPWSMAADESLDQGSSSENIEQNMLDCYMGFGVAGDMDNILFGQYEDHGGMNMS
jgi:hypothetical protein